jgi:hypothetical protein
MTVTDLAPVESVALCCDTNWRPDPAADAGSAETTVAADVRRKAAVGSRRYFFESCMRGSLTRVGSRVGSIAEPAHHPG